MQFWQSSQLDEALKVARDIVMASSGITLKYFRKKFDIEKKADQSLVTVADKECEIFIREHLQGTFPTHTFLGEELGEQKADSSFRWLIDPVDGTINFTRGLPFWGTLLALEHEGEIVLGVIHLPAMNQTIFAAKGRGCFNGKERLSVSSVQSLSEASLVFGDLKYFFPQPQNAGFMGLAKKVYHSRGWGDCYGYTPVITGAAEIMIDPIANPWDIAPMIICIEEAGGRLSDYKGERTIYGGNAVATNGLLHEEVLKILNSTTVESDS